MVTGVVVLGAATANVTGDRGQREPDERDGGDRQPRQHPGFDVAGVGPGDRHHHQGDPDDQQQCVLGFAPHNSTSPTAVASTVATTSVTGAKRRAKLRPNKPTCMATSFTSTAGPTTRNTSRGIS